MMAGQIPVTIGAVIPKLGKWLQQIPGTTYIRDPSPEQLEQLRYCAESSIFQTLGRGPKVEDGRDHPREERKKFFSIILYRVILATHLYFLSPRNSLTYLSNTTNERPTKLILKKL